MVPQRAEEAGTVDRGRSTTKKRGKNELRALDLFCGTKSVNDALQKMGYRVVNHDSDPKTNPDICEDIMKWKY